MPDLNFASGVLGGYLEEHHKEQDRSDMLRQQQRGAALDAAKLLIGSGRVQNYDSIAPIIDMAMGTEPGGKVAKGQPDHHAILGPLLHPILSGQMGSGSTNAAAAGQPTPSPLGNTGAPGGDPNAPVGSGSGFALPSPAAAAGPVGATAPVGATGPAAGSPSPIHLMNDQELASQQSSIDARKQSDAFTAKAALAQRARENFPDLFPTPEYAARAFGLVPPPKLMNVGVNDRVFDENTNKIVAEGLNAPKMPAGPAGQALESILMKQGINPMRATQAQIDAALPDASKLANARLQDEAKQRQQMQDLHAATLSSLNQKMAGEDPASVARKLAQVQRSYQFEDTQLTKKLQPVQQQASDIQKIQTALDAHNIQADADIGPQLLKVVAGGTGSGLRLTQAEINQTLGGRTAYEALQAGISRFIKSPSEATSLGVEQRKQIQAIVSVYNDRIQRKLALFEDAQRDLATAGDTGSHKLISSALQERLNAVDRGNDPVAARRLKARQYLLSNGKHVDDATVDMLLKKPGIDQVLAGVK